MTNDTPSSVTYGPSAQLLHWLIGLLVIGLIAAGLIMKFDLAPRPVRHFLAFLHIGFGITVLVLMVVRLAVRSTSPPPRLPAALPAPERRLAKAGHLVFYALLFAMPVFGILFVEARGAPLQWFGLLTLPALVGKNATIHHWFGFLHFWGGMALIAVIILHAVAVIRHHRHGVPVLRRMLPGGVPVAAGQALRPLP